MRGRGIATACAIMSAGALVLQGCGRKMPADATEETNTEITMESVETTKAEEIPTDLPGSLTISMRSAFGNFVKSGM